MFSSTTPTLWRAPCRSAAWLQETGFSRCNVVNAAPSVASCDCPPAKTAPLLVPVRAPTQASLTLAEPLVNTGNGQLWMSTHDSLATLGALNPGSGLNPGPSI